jgi:hypothetical protein
MRRFVPALVTAAVALGLVQPGDQRALAQPRDAASVLAAARTALGGEARLAAIKTMIATGRTRQVRGENLIPIEFEIQLELPDKYSRRDEFPAQDSGPSTSGFNGDNLVLIPRPPPPPPRPGAPAPTPAQQEAALRGRLMTAKQDFARLMLGLFATSFTSFPLTYIYAAQAEAPQGKADVIDVKGPANFAARLFVHAETHLPIMLTWQAPAGPRPGGPPAGGAPPSGPTAAGAPSAGPPSGGPPPGGPPPGGPPSPPPGAPGGPPAGGAGTPPSGAPAGGPPRGAAPAGAPSPGVEQRMFFADHREVDGLRLPFRIRRAAGAETTEETTFDRFRLNVRVDPRRFDTNPN